MTLQTWHLSGSRHTSKEHRDQGVWGYSISNTSSQQHYRVNKRRTLQCMYLAQFPMQDQG
jgi:hypothetical protein